MTPTVCVTAYRLTTFTTTWLHFWSISIPSLILKTTRCILPKNAKVLGKFKDECNCIAPLEFVGFRFKMYSFLVSRRHTKMTAKGVKKSYTFKTCDPRNVLHTLQNKINLHSCSIIKLPITKPCSRNATNQQIDKICVSAYDDKRLLLWGEKNSLAYCHKDIPLYINSCFDGTLYER